MEKRRPAYEKADLRVFSGPESIDKTVRASLDALKGHFLP
jgi:hypothetical protein